MTMMEGMGRAYSEARPGALLGLHLPSAAKSCSSLTFQGISRLRPAPVRHHVKKAIEVHVKYDWLCVGLQCCVLNIWLPAIAMITNTVWQAASQSRTKPALSLAT